MGGTPDVRVRLSAEGELSIINAFKRIQNQAETTGRVGASGLGALSQAASSLGRLLPALSFGAIVAGATAMAKQCLTTAAEFAHLSEKTGVSVETLSAYAHAADLTDVPVESLAKGLAKLAKTAQAAAQGNLTAQQAFGDLGIKVTDSQGRLRPLDDLLGDVAEKFAGMADGARKSALAQNIFGKAGAELIPFLNLGRAGLAEMKAEAEALGLVLTKKTAVAAEEFEKALKRVRGTLQGLIYAELAALLPNLSEFIVKLGLLNLELEEWKLRLESAGYAAIGAAEALIPFHGKEARGFFAMATDAANEAMQVQMKWNAQLSKGVAALAALDRKAKKPAGEPPPVTDKAARDKTIDTLKHFQDAQLALTRAELDQELALVKAHNAATTTEEAEKFKQGLTDLDVYFGNRRAMLEFEAKKEAEILTQEAEAIRQRIAEAEVRPLKKDEPASARTVEVMKLGADLAKVETQEQVRQIALGGERAKLDGEHRDEVRKLNVEQLTADAQHWTAQNQSFAAAMTELEAQIAGMQRLKGEEDAMFAARQNAVREAGQGRIQFETLQAEAQQSFAAIESGRTGIEALVQRGLISEYEGQRQLLLLEKERLPQLQAIAAAMTAAAITPEQIEAARQFTDQLTQLAASTDSGALSMAQFKKSLDQALTSDLANWFSRGIDDAKSFGDAFRGLALSVVQSLREIVAQMLATIIIAQIMKAVLGFASAGAGAASGTITAGTEGGGSGALAGATGGLVRGPGTSTSDSIPARLSDYEYVVQAAAVRRPGILEELEAINNLRSYASLRPRTLGATRGFATGGLVEAGAAGAKASRADLGIALDDVLYLKRVSATPDWGRIFVRTAQEHRKSIKGLLG